MTRQENRQPGRALLLVASAVAARAKGQRLVLALTGGSSTDLTTRGQFDLAKWKKRMDTYDKSTLKNAVAAAPSKRSCKRP